MEDPSYRYKVTVFEDQSIRGFALPGGSIFISSGLVRVAENEAQLVAFLTKLIAHAHLRHTGAQLIDEKGSNEVMVNLARIAENQEGAPEEIEKLGQDLMKLRFSSEREKEATRLAVRLEARTGYDPQGLIEVLEKLRVQPSPFADAHVNIPDQIETAKAEIHVLNLPPDRVITGPSLQAIHLRLP
jgi:predicted Zn-dependent protease